MANLSQLYFIGMASNVDSVLDYFTADDAVYPQGAEAAARGRNNHPLVIFPKDENTPVDFPGVLSRAGDVLLNLVWAATAIVGDVLWDVSWERDNPTFGPPQANLDVNSFAPSKTVLSPAPTASGLLREASITFTSAEMGSLLPGEPYRIRVRRNAGVALDKMAGDAQLFRVILKAAP